MAICKKCGSEIKNGVLFCTECGTKVEEIKDTPRGVSPEPAKKLQQAVPPMQPAQQPTQQSMPHPSGQTAPQPVQQSVQQPAQQQAQQPVQRPPVQQQPMQQPMQPSVQGQAQQMPPRKLAEKVPPQQQQQQQQQVRSKYNKPVSTVEFFFEILLYFIPIVGLIPMIIIAFTAKNPNRRNFAKAFLIWAVIFYLLIAGFALWYTFWGEEIVNDFINHEITSRLTPKPAP